MEAAAALFVGTAPTLAPIAALGSGVGVIAPATAGLIGAGGAIGAGGFLTSFSGLDILKGGFSLASGLSDIRSSQLQATAMEEQAMFADVQAKQAVLQGRQEALQIEEKLNDVLAANITRGFAGGLRGSGSVAQASEDAIAEANIQTGITRDNAAIISASRSSQGRVFRTEAEATRTSGVTRAVSKAADFFDV